MDPSPKYSFGGSNTLQLQIERGAPADVFASASPNEAQALFRQGLCTRPVTFAINRPRRRSIPNSNPGNVTLGLLAALRRGAASRSGRPVCRSAPTPASCCGACACPGSCSSNPVSQQTNVGQVASQVSLGAADAGFVYYTDGAGGEGPHEDAQPAQGGPTAGPLPDLHRRAPGADTGGAAAFIKQVTGKAGRGALNAYGFGLPPR